jgi:hypothetical protein
MLRTSNYDPLASGECHVMTNLHNFPRQINSEKVFIYATWHSVPRRHIATP